MSPNSRRSKRTYVEHTYADHYNDPIYNPGELEDDDGDSPKRRGPRGGVVVPFPERLFTMLSQIEKEGFEDVVGWQPHGRCFVVHQPKRFVEEVMPKYFRQSKLTSFQRQVNLYGFRRLTAGKDRGGYYHELFLRGRPDLHRRLVRIRVKGTGFKSASSPATEPDFYTYPRCVEEGPSKISTEPSNASNEAVADMPMSCPSESLMHFHGEPLWKPLSAPPKIMDPKPLEAPKLLSFDDSNAASEPWKIKPTPSMSLSSFARNIVCEQTSNSKQQNPCPVTPEFNPKQIYTDIEEALAIVSPIDSPATSPYPSMLSLDNYASSSLSQYEDLLSAPLPLPSEDMRFSSYTDDEAIVDNILIDNLEVPSDYSLDPLFLLEEISGPVSC